MGESKTAIGLRVIGDMTTGEAEEVRDAIEEALGEEYRVLIYDSRIQLMDAEEVIEELGVLVESATEDHAPE